MKGSKRISTRPPLVFCLLLGFSVQPAIAGELFVGTDASGVLTITDSPTATESFRVLEAPAPEQVSTRYPRPRGESVDRFDEAILGSATRHGVSAALLKAVCFVESAMNPWAVSRAGAMGLMQLMPSTARMLHVPDPLDPYSSLDGGAQYLAGLLADFPDVRVALAAYNAGPHYVRRHGGIPPLTETNQFVDRVMYYYEYFLLKEPIGDSSF